MSRPFLLSVVDVGKSSDGKVTLVSNQSATVSLIKDSDVAKPANPAKVPTISKWSFTGFPATHTFDAKTNSMVPKEDITAGQWLLVVQAANRSPVVQRLTLTDEKGFLRAKAGWSGTSPAKANPNLQAAAVDIHNRAQVPKGKKSPPVQSTVTAKLFPRREFILMSGIETHHGDQFSWRVLPEGRRNTLGRRGVIGQGDVVTMLHCESRERLTFVKAAAPGQWLLIDQFVKSGTKRTTNDFKKEPKAPEKDIDILDFYRCLDEAGQTAPGTVAEASIFSHGFYGGPVLFNTDDLQGDPTRRDDKDLDGRAKDWNASATMSTFPGVKKALASDGFLKIWGCNALRLLHGMIDAAENKLRPTFDKDTFFTGSVSITKARQLHPTETAQHLTERTTIRRLLKTDIAEKFRTGYVPRAAAFLGKPCLGALPGSGSIHPQDTKTRDFRMVIEPGNDRVFELFVRELAASDAIDSDGKYADYGKLAPRLAPIAAPTFSFERFKMLTVIKKVAAKSFTEIELASGTTVTAPPLRGGHALTFAHQRDVVALGREGMFFVAVQTDVQSIGMGPNGFPLVSLAHNPSRDMAFYVQDDGAVYLLTRAPAGSGNWNLDLRTYNIGSARTVTDGKLQTAWTGHVF